MIYLDNNATTKPSLDVMEAMMFFLTDCYYNASASTSVFTGADQARDDAAKAMAELLNAEDSDCFTFTSGATESNNWILSSLRKSGRLGHLITSTIEHASVSEPLGELARCGFRVREVPVDNQGVVCLEDLRKALRPDTTLVSIIAANNETGVLQPINEIGQMVRQYSPNAIFHTDATQAVGKVSIDLQVGWADVDIVSFSAHKFHGPKGVGGVYHRPGIDLPPLLLGGGQEDGRRSGTTNTAGLAGLAVAAKGCKMNSAPVMKALRDQFEIELLSLFPGAQIHSMFAPRLFNTSCFSLAGVVGEDLVSDLAAIGILVGTGAACTSGALHPPKTLLAMKVSYECARAALRVSISRFTTIDDLRALLRGLQEIL